MLKIYFKLFFTLFITFVFNAQQGDGGKPKGWKSAMNEIPEILFKTPDVKKLKIEDSINDKIGNSPWRFGYNNYSNINLLNSGIWTELPNGDFIWRLKLTCKGALTTNLTFTNLVIPEGNELYVYNPSKDFILGKFTAYHTYDGQLGTELVPGETSIVEYYVPKNNITNKGSITISTVTHGYRTSREYIEKSFGQSGNCNMNVNCSDGAAWVNQRNAALMLVSGSNGFCSGALVNNTANDGKPYVLTANHCYSNPATWIFRFNYQSPDCNDPASDPTNFQSLSGSVLRARRTPSDFCLVEITGGLVNNTVPSNCNPYFNGWDNTGAIPNGAVSIHHPSGDIKKISFDDAPLSISQGMSSTEANSTWTLEWDRNTTTEGGSSGSPLFDLNHRIIGQLWGGSASCTNLTANDYYGRFSMSWNPPGSDQTNQLKFWLDPSNTGATIIDGYDPNGTPLVLDGNVGNINGANGVLCNVSATPSFVLTNVGSSNLTSATIQYGYNGTLNQTYNWVGNLAQYGSATINLPATSLAQGNNTFMVNLTHVNGMVDPNTVNNTVQSSFMNVVGGNILTLNLELDCYGSETTWELRDNSTNQLLYFGGPYQDLINPVVETQNFCVNEGCFKFIIMDDFGDGMSGCATANGGDGSYAILHNQDTLIFLNEANANFGSSSTKSFCFPGSAGLGENELSTIVVFPNPVNTNLSIQSESVILKVSIYQMTGNLVFERMEEGSSTYEIAISDFSNGIYQLIVQTENGQYIQKIQVQH